MGESQWTAEELAILGEEVEETAEVAPESQEAESEEPTEEATETEQVPESEEADETPDLDALIGTEPDEAEDDVEDIPEDGKIPYNRFSKIYARAKELERKNDLLKRNPKAYYELYPDERPSDEKRPDEVSQTQPINLSNIDGLRVEGGQYDGMTLAEVKQVDVTAALQLENAYIRQNLPNLVSSQVKAVMQQTTAAQQKDYLLQESQKEIDAFTESRSMEFFKKPISELSEIESKKLEKLVEKTIEWGTSTGRGAGVLEDMYYLMNKESMVRKAKAAGAGALLDAATKGAKVKSIRSSGEAPSGGSGFDSMLDMSESNVTDMISNMPDAKFSKLMREGSQELRDKFPQWPWE